MTIEELIKQACELLAKASPKPWSLDDGWGGLPTVREHSLSGGRNAIPANKEDAEFLIFIRNHLADILDDYNRMKSCINVCHKYHGPDESLKETNAELREACSLALAHLESSHRRNDIQNVLRKAIGFCE